METTTGILTTWPTRWILPVVGLVVALEAMNAVSLAPFATSSYYAMCRAPVPTAADWQDKRARVASGTQALLLERLGATRVVVTAPEIAEAMARGQIDCAIIPFTFLKSYSVADSAKYIVDLPILVSWAISPRIIRRAGSAARWRRVEAVLAGFWAPACCR
ncbi:hypothetical protein [Celeribacter indicus]|uniref:hypothetical protein n=1 Tax=Celeribacter indicus TaxID=1208324 RepID=UPI0015875048|nr:hypothetical protein [Celeribacter indicus]